MSAPSTARRSSASLDRSPVVHLIIPTHTTRHLAACLASLSWQTTPPQTVVVTCDTDDPRISELLAGVWPAIAAKLAARKRRVPTLLYTRRPHQGEARLNQVRNNAVRTLQSHAALRLTDHIIVLDGDTLLAPDAVERHAGLHLLGHDVVVAYRVNLTQEQSNSVSAESILNAADPSRWLSSFASPDTEEALRLRDARYRRHLSLRRMGPLSAWLIKDHKIKVLGGHHSLSAKALLAVNGYDEEYAGYGYDDDDLSRRLHSLRPRLSVAVAVREILAYHVWHPTRAPGRPTDAPGFARFSTPGLPARALHGVDNPRPQPEPTVSEVSASRLNHAVPT